MHIFRVQTLIKTPAKFQKDPAKTVGGVAFTRYPVSKCLSPKTTTGKSELQKSDKNLSEDYSKMSCTSSDLEKNRSG